MSHHANASCMPTNHGHTSPNTPNNQSSWICGTCDTTVTWNDIGVVCDRCGQWYHGHCQSIGSTTYNHLNDSSDLQWHCAVCGNPNSRTAFDLYGVDSSASLSHSLPTQSDSSLVSTPTNTFKPFHASTPSRAGQQNKWKDRPLRILNVNFQSASSKRAELPHLIDSLKPDIIIGTETWLDPDISDAEIFPHSFKLYRKDRNRNGGGVLIAVRDNIDSYKVQDLEVQDCELIWTHIKLKGRRSLYVAAFYRPNVADTDSIAGLQTSLQRATQMKNAHLLVGGDFNFPGWDWTSMQIKQKCPFPNLHQNFADIVSDHGLQQMVNEPTRGENTLDLFLTNSPQLIPRVEIIPGLSDHDIPYCEFSLNATKKAQPIREIPLYAKADWENLRKCAKTISCNILTNIHKSTTEELWCDFKDTLLEAVKEHIPHKTTKSKTSMPWITTHIKRMIAKKNRLYRKMKKSGDKKLTTKVYNLKQAVQREMRRSYWSYLNGVFDNEKKSQNNKRFWSYIKNQKSNNVGVAPLKMEGHLTSDPKEQAEILNRQFQSVFSEGREYTTSEFLDKTSMKDTNIPVMDDINITEEGVKKLLLNLNPHKASGPDGLSPLILKELASELAPGVTAIFKSSLTSGVVPSDWRNANVTPIFKKGEHYDPANYRPISLTCIVCKLMEHIMVSNIMDHFEKHSVLTDYQHGFRRLRSCETQLLEFTEELTTNLEKGLHTDVLIMDFAKAFDRVNHSLLMHKISRYGVQGTTQTWINSFLHDRQQAVIVNGSRSSEVPVKSGVPQGSVLGPCLFLAYINDLPLNLTTTARLFADDTAVYSTDNEKLQADLHQLGIWEGSWDMKFHPAKCESMPITRARTPKINEYHLHGHTLETVKVTKYLGVSMKKDLAWDEHINTISNKANKTLGFLRRNLKISSPNIKEKAYKTFVRPVLEYASTVWDPHTQKNISKIESVQRRAARYVLNRHHNTSSVSDMLNKLQWPKLEHRRKSARLTMLFKIKHHLAECPVIRKKLTPAPLRQRRGHNKQYSLITHRTQYRGFSFLPRTIRDWNQLDAKTIEATTIDAFVASCYADT